MINHFNFMRFDDEYLVTNDFGRYAFIGADDLRRLASDSVERDSPVGELLRERGFVFDGSRIDFVTRGAPVVRSLKRPLFAPTSLHIFVASTACNLDCVYCQAHDCEPLRNHSAQRTAGTAASRPAAKGTGSARQLMDEGTARRAVEIALESPTEALTFEFQGGEPLLNFPVIKAAIEHAERLRDGRDLRYSVVSNLAVLTDEMIAFFAEHGVSLSTSLDGPRPLHDANRPLRDGVRRGDSALDGMRARCSASLASPSSQANPNRSICLNRPPRLAGPACPAAPTTCSRALLNAPGQPAWMSGASRQRRARACRLPARSSTPTAIWD